MISDKAFFNNISSSDIVNINELWLVPQATITFFVRDTVETFLDSLGLKNPSMLSRRNTANMHPYKGWMVNLEKGIWAAGSMTAPGMISTKLVTPTFVRELAHHKRGYLASKQFDI